MAVVRVKRSTKRDVWRVRWRDDNRRMRSKTFDRKSDAEAYEAKVKLAKRNGSLEDLDAGKQTLKVFVDQWWRLYAEPNLAPATIKHYAALRDQYLIPRLGHYELRRLTPAVIQRLQSDLARNGVGAATIRKLLALLQGILERAVEWGRLKSNPVKVVKKPAQRRTRIVRAVAPTTVEALRRKLLDAGKLRDATLVSVLAYAGLRPGEALTLTWGDIGERTISVDKSLSLGEVKDTKTGRARTVPMLKPLAADLAEWRMASGRPESGALLFPTRAGRAWKETDYRNWRRRVYSTTAKTVGIESPRPYDLRHSLASLLFAEGMNPAEIAERMGHSLETLLRTYTHVIEELRGAERQPAETLIARARSTRRALSVPQRGSVGAN